MLTLVASQQVEIITKLNIVLQFIDPIMPAIDSTPQQSNLTSMLDTAFLNPYQQIITSTPQTTATINLNTSNTCIHSDSSTTAALTEAASSTSSNPTMHVYDMLNNPTAVPLQQESTTTTTIPTTNASNYMSTSTPSTGVTSGCIPLKASKNHLCSSMIDTSKLHNITQTVASYHKLHVESKAPTLAVKLARECYFGESVMKLCTPMGFRDEPGLPLNELWELKKTVFNIFPKFWACPVEFEPLWTSCIDALGHACRRLKV